MNWITGKDAVLTQPAVPDRALRPARTRLRARRPAACVAVEQARQAAALQQVAEGAGESGERDVRFQRGGYHPPDESAHGEDGSGGSAEACALSGVAGSAGRGAEVAGEGCDVWTKLRWDGEMWLGGAWACDE